MILLILVGTLQGGTNVSIVGLDPIVSLYENGTWFEQIQNRLTHFLYFRTEAIFIIPMNIFLFYLVSS